MEHASVPSNADNARIDAVLYQLMAMPTRVFVVHMVYPLAERLFRRAKKASMMSEEYVWATTNGVSGFMERFSPENVDAVQGIVSLQPYVEATNDVRNFSARLRVRSRLENPGDADGVDSTVMRMWEYDTAWQSLRPWRPPVSPALRSRLLRGARH
jgi:hypothetical protein